MAFAVRAKLEGAAAVLKRLEVLPEKVRKKVLRQAVAGAARTVAKTAKANVKAIKETGMLGRSIGSKVKAYSRGSKSTVGIVGPRKGFRESVLRSRGKWKPAAPKPSGFADPTKYAHLVERGTKRSRAVWFLRDALTRNESAIVAKMAEIIEAGIQKEAAKP